MMIDKKLIISMMQKSYDGLCASGIIEENLGLTSDTPIFGGGSQLDSMAFVAFITDVENAISKNENNDLFVVLSDIEEMYPDSPVLTVDMFAGYLLSICKQ